MGLLAGRTVAVCITGSIAAYKAVEVIRLLVGHGARVIPVLSASGAKFVGPVTLSGITGRAVASDMWDPSYAGEMHVALSDEADAVVVVPATADVLSRLAHGRADDLTTALCLCAKGPVFVAPAMHTRMWLHPATQENVRSLTERAAVEGRVAGEASVERAGRLEIVGPVEGPLASGDVGMGRMVEPAALVERICEQLRAEPLGLGELRGFREPRTDLSGLRVLVTAGPTVEDLDPVRYLGNRSSGKMGFALAERAARRGADVTLVAGPVSLRTPAGVRRIDVRSALEMRAAVWEAAGDDLSRVDAIVMAAAVADHRPVHVSKEKTKKSGERIVLELERTPDILHELGTRRATGRPVLIGFAVESGSESAIVAYAEDKRVRKSVDLVVANAAATAFAGDENQAWLVGPDGVTSTERMSKLALADVILDRIVSLNAASPS
jgi:phosphopantothenoylcysteine decarboxylase/phosphopantothenate--cysteine ligase